MRAGPLRHRVEIQQATESADAHNQAVQTWATVAWRWAQIRPSRGRETFDAQTPVSDVTHEIILRHYDRTLTPKFRIRHGTRLFGIVSSVTYEERNRRTVVHAREEVA